LWRIAFRCLQIYTFRISLLIVLALSYLALSSLLLRRLSMQPQAGPMLTCGK
jgi:hypothetical protein